LYNSFGNVISPVELAVAEDDFTSAPLTNIFNATFCPGKPAIDDWAPMSIFITLGW